MNCGPRFPCELTVLILFTSGHAKHFHAECVSVENGTCCRSILNVIAQGTSDTHKNAGHCNKLIKDSVCLKTPSFKATFHLRVYVTLKQCW